MGAVALLLTVAVVGGGVVVGLHMTSHSSASAPTPVPVRNPPGPAPAPVVSPEPDPATGQSLEAEFASFQTTLDAKVGVVVLAVGPGKEAVRLGDWDIGPAWSTIKVPLAIAELRNDGLQEATDAMVAAITQSDNAAAEQIWASLGDPVIAAGKVEAVLADYGDQTTVESQRHRPEFSIFGQTQWSLANQARFLAGAVCAPQNDPIIELMGQITSAQQWGLGVMADTKFKGGWGPSPNGQYLVRQMGVISGPAGETVVAMAAEPDSGTFGDGTRDLTDIANWLDSHRELLPSGECSR